MVICERNSCFRDIVAGILAVWSLFFINNINKIVIRKKTPQMTARCYNPGSDLSTWSPISPLSIFLFFNCIDTIRGSFCLVVFIVLVRIFRH